MARTRKKGPIFKERVQKVKGHPFVVRVFAGENDHEWESFLNSLPNYARRRIGPICPHYRTTDGAFNWASYEWPVEVSELSIVYASSQPQSRAA